MEIIVSLRIPVGIICEIRISTGRTRLPEAGTPAPRNPGVSDAAGADSPAQAAREDTSACGPLSLARTQRAPRGPTAR